jgi:predicted DNA-binding WGR domain protein
MSAGDVAGAQRVLSNVSRWKEQPAHNQPVSSDAVAQQLAETLRNAGYIVDQGVGQSHFRVDLAVRTSADRNYRLGILIDTAHQYEQAEPLERDVMRPMLLQNFGWQIESVLGKDWYESREQELARILNILEGKSTGEATDEDEEEKVVTEPEERLTSEPADEESSASTQNLDIADDGAPEQLAVELASQSISMLPADLICSGEARRFEFQGDGSQKFWEITVTGSGHTVRFGRIGTLGQSQTKSFSSEVAAQNEARRLIAGKLRKGYREATKPT